MSTGYSQANQKRMYFDMSPVNYDKIFKRAQEMIDAEKAEEDGIPCPTIEQTRNRIEAEMPLL